ncbi:uncharacterized protein N7459_000066 [Penicillium hispanicum]|uniref:uncharacterized protein n=1 Tax=Penicillium hispanicum TaxID=1080232 RepID=UPI0025415171|nr:uncharacterized protein N7459_000066 [Penicillium hispanicum]KAJ5593858.1 hypothetical protein N7459_000066 [Penicillium hispanicum]
MSLCSMEAPIMQNQPEEELAYPHFALIYIDRDGILRHEASPSIANSRESILSPRVTDAFLRAVAMSTETGQSHTPFAPGAPPSPPPIAVGGRHLFHHLQVVPVPQGPAIPPTMWQAHREPWSPSARQNPQQPKRTWNEDLSMTSNPKALISIQDKDFLRRYYEKVFQNLQQTNCRVLAKAYVKLVEPRKQVNYPYNGRKIVAGRTQQLDPDETKPPWWPSGVSHREPDHLPKAERIRLLVHLLCELRTSHGITARRLREADQPIRRQISPAERLQLLDEMYQVREEEEKALEKVKGGEHTEWSLYSRRDTHQVADGEALVSISRANLPDAVEVAVSQVESRRKSSATDETSDQEPKTETMSIRSRPVPSVNIPSPVFVPGPGADAFANIPPNSIPTTPTQYIKQDLPIHTAFDTAEGASMSAQDLKRKRQCVETGLPATTSPTSLAQYHSPIFVGSQPFMNESYDNLQAFQHQMIPTTRPGSFGESMDANMFPYYFDG